MAILAENPIILGKSYEVKVSITDPLGYWCLLLEKSKEKGEKKKKYPWIDKSILLLPLL